MLAKRNSWLQVPVDAEIERVALALSAVEHESAWARTIEVGRLVFDGILGGDEIAWRSRRSFKSISLRKLVEHPHCPFRKSALCQAVGIHLFVKLRPSIIRMPGITPTHVAQTLGLEPTQMTSLLSASSAAGWSVRELSRHVRAVRKQSGERRGRPSISGAERAVTFARRASALLHCMQEQLVASEHTNDESTRALFDLFDEILDVVDDARHLPMFDRKPSTVVPLASTSVPRLNSEISLAQVVRVRRGEAATVSDT